MINNEIAKFYAHAAACEADAYLKAAAALTPPPMLTMEECMKTTAALTTNEILLIGELGNLVALIRNQDCTITRKGEERCLAGYLDGARDLINSILGNQPHS